MQFFLTKKQNPDSGEAIDIKKAAELTFEDRRRTLDNLFTSLPQTFLIRLAAIPVFALLRQPAVVRALRRLATRPWSMWWIVGPTEPLVARRA